jgi:hypothetical protein
MTYTTRNIEDWDFRNWTSPLKRDPSSWMKADDEADSFLMGHFVTVLAIEHTRLLIVADLLKQGYAKLSDDKADIVLEPLGAAVLPHMTSWRDVLTSEGRSYRQVVKALVREWRKNGRIKSTILPIDMREHFPGLFRNSREGQASQTSDS